MKKRKLLLIGLLMWNINYVLGQSCGTPHPVNPTIYPQENTNVQARGSSSALCIDVFFHIVRNTNGTNAFTTPNLDAIVDDLNEFYSPHNIIINNAGSDFINNSNFVNIDNDTEARNLGQTNNRNYAINYYIVETLWNVNSGFITGTANSIPSNNLVIRRDRVLTSTSPHELGHCLNLLHTHETARGVEAINGSNCSSAGDLVCDTPADSGQGTVNGYNPDLTNLMSYYHNFGFTLDHFTNGQGHRMRYAIRNEYVLQNIGSNLCTTISEVNNVCYSQTKTVSLTNVGGATTIWLSSSNIQVLSSSNTNAQIRATNYSSTGNGWIRATLSNGITLQEDFFVGTENFGPNYYMAIDDAPELVVETVDGYNYEIQWRINGNIINNSNNQYWMRINLEDYNHLCNNGKLKLSMRVNGECGWSKYKSFNYDCSENYYSTYPNPSSETLTIRQEVESYEKPSLIKARKLNDNSILEIYNLNNNLIHKGNIFNQETINVSKYKKGIYILKIKTNTNIETHSIIIR